MGCTKTGSTSIQHTLDAAKGLQRVKYVSVSRPNSSRALMLGFLGEAVDQPHLARKGLDEDAAKTEREVVRDGMAACFQADADLFVLSAEGAAGLQSSELRRLREFLLQHVDEIKVVAYVRDLRGFVESAFQQRLKAGHRESLRFAQALPRYRKQLERFDKVFGAENVELWPFEPAKFPDKDVVLDFCARLGIDLAGVTCDSPQ